MRGVVFTGERQIEMMEFPDPTPGPGEVVVEMKASGMCGSDLHQYRRPKSGGAAIGGLPCRRAVHTVPDTTRRRRAKHTPGPACGTRITSAEKTVPIQNQTALGTRCSREQ